MCFWHKQNKMMKINFINFSPQYKKFAQFSMCSYIWCVFSSSSLFHFLKPLQLVELVFTYNFFLLSLFIFYFIFLDFNHNFLFVSKISMYVFLLVCLGIVYFISSIRTQFIRKKNTHTKIIYKHIYWYINCQLYRFKRGCSVGSRGADFRIISIRLSKQVHFCDCPLIEVLANFQLNLIHIHTQLKSTGFLFYFNLTYSA